MILDQPEPTREPKQTFLIAYSNPAASAYLHWLKRSTDHHEVALDCQSPSASLDDLVRRARDRAEVERAVGSAFDEVWVVFDGPPRADTSTPTDIGVVVNTPNISTWLDLHARPEDTAPVYAGRYSQAKAGAIELGQASPGTNMYRLVDALLESLRAFRALDAPPTL